MVDGSENATVGGDMNFRFRMLLKGAVKLNLNLRKFVNEIRFSVSCFTNIHLFIHSELKIRAKLWKNIEKMKNLLENKINFFYSLHAFRFSLLFITSF